MRRAGQTPHGARPNREGFPGKPSGFAGEACRLGAPQPPGRSLEPRSNAWPRGMTVLPETADRIRLTGPAATKKLTRDEDSVTTTEFFAHLKSFRNLEPAYQIIEHNSGDTFPDGRHASTELRSRKGRSYCKLKDLRLSAFRFPAPAWLQSQPTIVGKTTLFQLRFLGSSEMMWRAVYLEIYIFASIGQRHSLLIACDPYGTSSEHAMRREQSNRQKPQRPVTRSLLIERVAPSKSATRASMARPVKEDLDSRAQPDVRGGLGSTRVEVERELRFIGDQRVGGVAGFPSAVA